MHFVPKNRTITIGIHDRQRFSFNHRDMLWCHVRLEYSQCGCYTSAGLLIFCGEGIFIFLRCGRSVVLRFLCCTRHPVLILRIRSPSAVWTSVGRSPTRENSTTNRNESYFCSSHVCKQFQPRHQRCLQKPLHTVKICHTRRKRQIWMTQIRHTQYRVLSSTYSLPFVRMEWRLKAYLTSCFTEWKKRVLRCNGLITSWNGNVPGWQIHGA